MAHSIPALAQQSARDPLSRMRAVQISRELLGDAWLDADKLRHHPVTEKVSGQLYAAIGSIEANLGEGYSRSSGRDRARIFEYALGSVRESMVWYRASAPLLADNLVDARLTKLEEIRRLLLAIIPRERTRKVQPATE